MKTDETVVVIHLIAVKICIIAEGFVITAILAINIIIIIIIIIIIVIEKKEAGLLSLDFYYSEEKKTSIKQKFQSHVNFHRRRLALAPALPSIFIGFVGNALKPTILSAGFSSPTEVITPVLCV